MGLIAPIVGHVGDGNFHVLVLIDVDDPEGDRAVGERSSRGSIMRAIAMDGTCTGEHGIGQGKIGFLDQELGAWRSTSCATIKRALDPHNIMNPGKILSHPRR